MNSNTHKSSLFLEIDTFDNSISTNKYNLQNLSPLGLSIDVPTYPMSPTTRLEIDTYDNFSLCDDDRRVQNLTHEIETLNDSVTKKCTVHNESEKIGHGSSAGIFELSENPNLYVKISDLPYDSYMLSKSNAQGITCDTIGDKLNVSINEINNAIKYEKLSYAFPHNIMKIQSAERCKKDYSGIEFFANKFLIEKINGLTLDKAIKTMNEHELLCCVVQLVYILSYANMHGYFHNDITCNNIMIYYENITPLIFNKLFLSDNNVICKFNLQSLPIVKLIDFSYSEHINYASISTMRKKVVIGEPQQVLKIIRNKLIHVNSPLQHSTIFNQLCSLFDILNKENPLLGYRYSELEAQISSVGFRTLTESEIIEMSITKKFAEVTLLNCFNEMKHFFNRNLEYGIRFDFVSTFLNLELPSLQKKSQLTPNSTKKHRKITQKTSGEYTLPELQQKYLTYAQLNDAMLQEYYK